MPLPSWFLTADTCRIWFSERTCHLHWAFYHPPISTQRRNISGLGPNEKTLKTTNRSICWLTPLSPSEPADSFVPGILHPHGGSRDISASFKASLHDCFLKRVDLSNPSGPVRLFASSGSFPTLRVQPRPSASQTYTRAGNLDPPAFAILMYSDPARLAGIMCLFPGRGGRDTILNPHAILHQPRFYQWSARSYIVLCRRDTFLVQSSSAGRSALK